MKRPILIVTIGYVIGLIWELYFKISIAFLYAIIILVIIILKKYKLLFRYINLILNKKVIFLFILMSFIASIYIKILDNKYDKLYRDVNEGYFTGTVVNIGKMKEHKTIYKLKIDNINGNSKFKNTMVYLNMKNSYNISFAYGDKICFWGEFDNPEVSSNYKGFDYKEYLKNLKIYGNVNYIRNLKIVKNNDLNILHKLILDIKKSIIINSERLFSEDERNIFLAVSVGYTDYISNEIKEDFRNSNLSHILAISGTHIAYIVLGLSAVLKLSKINSRLSKIITSTILFFYMIMVDFTPSVTRACVMGILLLISNFLYVKQDSINAVCISLICILIPNPYNIRNIGLLLSYGGYIGIRSIKSSLISIVNNKFKKEEKSLKEYNRLEKVKNNSLSYINDIIYTTISAQIVIFPIIMYNFNLVSLNFLISNLLVNSIIGIITVGGFTLCITIFISSFLSKLISIPYKFFLDLLIGISKICANMPLANLYIITPSIFNIIVYYVILFGSSFIYNLYLKKEKRKTEIKFINIVKRILYKIRVNKTNIILILIIFIIIFNLIKIIPKDLKIYFIDVGQGDCCLVITPNNKKLLIDGGGREGVSDFDVGKNTLLPYLLDRRINKVDYIIISHFDSDHCEGLFYVMEKIKIKNAIIGKQFEECNNYEKFIELVRKKKVNLIIAEAGNKVNIERNLYLDILWPSLKNRVNENILNNNSLVCKLVYNNFSILFTGDIEKIAEEKILSMYKGNIDILKSTVLKVAHHGSKSSSITEFLNTVKPKFALIGVGKDNKFGHPSNITINNLTNIKCHIYRTDVNGEIVFTIKKRGKVRIDKKIKDV